MARFTIFRGDTRIFEVTVKDENGDPIDISTGGTWAFVMSIAKTAGQAIADVTLDGQIVNGPGGIVRFELTPEDTAVKGTFYWDVQATTPDDRVYTVDSGKLSIVQDVTP